MFSFTRLAVLATLALPALAAATPVEVVARGGSPPPTQGGNCNTGPIQCCNSVKSADDKSVSSLFGLLGIVVGPLEGLVGLGCSPISVIGVGSGGSCNAHPVCCENNSVGSLISIGCVPITL